VNLIACTLASHPAAIKEVSGLEVRLDLAREWTRSLADACPCRPPGSLWLAISLRSVAHATLFGPWSVKVVNELNRCTKDAQDILLTCLDRMKPGHAFLGTTNLHVVAARL
jgi:hypothetical protein